MGASPGDRGAVRSSRVGYEAAYLSCSEGSREAHRADSMNMNGILIGSENPQRLRDYYTKLFGKPNWDEGGYFGWRIGSGTVTIGPHDPEKGKSSAPGGAIANIPMLDGKG